MSYYPDLSPYVPQCTFPLYLSSLEVTKDSISISFTKRKTKAIKFKSMEDFREKTNPEIFNFFNPKVRKPKN